MSPSTNPNSSSKMSASNFFRFGFRKSKTSSKQQQQQATAQATLAPAAPITPARHSKTRKPSLRVRTQSIAHPRPSTAITNAPARSGWFSDGDDLDDEDDEEDADATDAIDDFFGVTFSRNERRDRREGTQALLPKPKATPVKNSKRAVVAGNSQAFRSVLASPSSTSSSMTGSPASSLYIASPRSSTSSRTASSIDDAGCTNAIDDFFGVARRQGNLNGRYRVDTRRSGREYQVSAATASMLSPGAAAYDRRFSSSFVVAKPAYK